MVYSVGLMREVVQPYLHPPRSSVALLPTRTQPVSDSHQGSKPGYRARNPGPNKVVYSSNYMKKPYLNRERHRTCTMRFVV